MDSVSKIKLESDYRLPKSVVPRHYDLEIKTDLEELKFYGKCEIHLDIKEDTAELILNIHPHLLLLRLQLQLPSETIDFRIPGMDSAQAGQDDHWLVREEELERVVMRLKGGRMMKVGDAVRVGGMWEGDVSDGTCGYYYCETTTTPKQRYASTLFEPAHARSVFPCFDETWAKATFRVVMLAKRGLVCLGNAEVERKEEGKGQWVRWLFKKTGLMATYLVAFAVGPFKSLESSFTSISGRTIPLRFWALPSLVSQGQLTLSLQERALPIYEKLFNIPIPYEKLETLQVERHNGPAMENEGLMIGRLWCFEEGRSGLGERRHLVEIVLHEVAHIWAGNLCGIQNWNQLWLKEGLATLLAENVVAPRLEPTLLNEAAFLHEIVHPSLKMDCLSSHPVEQEFVDVAEAEESFDTITYCKGAAVLKMLFHLVGETAFIQGLALYFKKHAYGTATTMDLLDAMTKSSGKDLTDFRKWIYCAGYPILKVEQMGEKVLVTQERHFNDGHKETEPTMWCIPLNIKTIIDNKFFLNNPNSVLSTQSITLNLRPQDTWLLNASSIGFYRVSYPVAHLSRLTSVVSEQPELVSTLECMTLVSDAFALSFGGHQEVSAALDLALACRGRTEWTIWATIAHGIQSILPLLEGSARTGLEGVCLGLFGVKRMGLEAKEGEGVEEVQRRRGAVEMGMLVGSRELRDALEDIFWSTDGGENLPENLVDLKDHILAAAVNSRDEKGYLTILNNLLNPSSPTQRVESLSALAKVQDPARFAQVLQLFKEGKLKGSDVCAFVGAVPVLAERIRRMAADHIIKNFDVFYEGSKDSGGFHRGMRSVFSKNSMEQDRLEFEKLVNDHEKEIANYMATITEIREQIVANIEWKKHGQAEVETWLEENEEAVMKLREERAFGATGSPV